MRHRNLLAARFKFSAHCLAVASRWDFTLRCLRVLQFKTCVDIYESRARSTGQVLEQKRLKETKNLVGFRVG
jgi:hypothetical protein